MQDKADPSETPAARQPRTDSAASGRKAEPAPPDAAGRGPDAGDTGSGGTDDARPTARKDPQPEIGGRDGPEPTRYGDWEVNGICTDF